MKIIQKNCMVLGLLFLLVSSRNLLAQDDFENYYFVDTSSPLATFTSYLDAMDKYNSLRERDHMEALLQLDRAAECFYLEHLPVMIRQKMGREAAILIKEVLDRLPEQKPPENHAQASDSKERFLAWKVPQTQIIIELINKGNRSGEYLFSQEAALNAGEMYRRYKNQPYREGVSGAGYVEPFYYQVVPGFLKREILLFRGWQWIGLLGIFAGGLAFLLLLRPLLRSLEKAILKTHLFEPCQGEPTIYRPLSYLILFILWVFFIGMLQIEGTAFSVMLFFLQVLISITAVWGALNLAGVLGDLIEYRLQKVKGSMIENHVIPLLKKSVRVMVVVIAGLVALENLGVNVMGLLAGLGLGGLAIALAAKDTAANIFGSLTILLDRPFKVGDWILIGDAEGTVEEIGLRSTRIRTFYDSLITIPNSSISMMNIDNYGLRTYRRIKTTLGVTYDTTPEKLEAFLEGIKNIIKANSHTRKDYFHVVFTGFGASSLDIMLYFFVEAKDWSQELVERQNIFLEVIRLAKELEVDFAFPTQTLHVDMLPDKDKKESDVTLEELRKVPAEFSKDGSKARPQGQGFFVPPYKEDS